MFMNVCQERIGLPKTAPHVHRRAALDVACPEIWRSIEEPFIKVVVLECVISRKFLSQNKTLFLLQRT